MGCDYYIYTVLKLVHTNGVSLIKLSEKPVYLHDNEYGDTDNYTIHPSKRRPKIDHMEPECEDVLIYKRGEPHRTHYMTEYMELIQEFIKCKDADYVPQHKILKHNYMFDHDTNSEGLENIDDIREMYIVELRAWRP